MYNTPKVGDFFVRHMDGETGRLIRLGQWLNGDGFRNFEHAGICVFSNGTRVQTIEAAPGGARLCTYEIAEVQADHGFLWSNLAGPTVSQTDRIKLYVTAMRCKGTPYSFMDYVAIAAHRFRLPLPWLRRYVATSKHMICSQLVDYCYQAAGIQLFADGRWNGYVTPGDLSGLVLGVHTDA